MHRKFILAAGVGTGLHPFASDGHSHDASVRLDEASMVVVRLQELEFLPCLPKRDQSHGDPSIEPPVDA